MTRLNTIFVSRNNFESILDTCIKILHNKTGKKIDHNDKLLFEIFNTIASQVFSIESKNPELQKHSPEQAIQIINGIVVDELVNYILSKKQIFLKESAELVNEKKAPKQDNISIEETITISVENSELRLNSPIEKITNITIKSLHMYTQDYLITELNNTLVINNNNDEVIVNITPGNYTSQTLLQAIEDSVFKETGTLITFTISDIDQTLNISPNININQHLSTLNNILGIGKKLPVKLIKRNKIQLGVKFCFENEINNFVYTVPLIINSNNNESNTGPVLKEFNLNYTKKFTRPVDLTDIKLDFDSYNHRGYPFYLMLNITLFA